VNNFINYITLRYQYLFIWNFLSQNFYVYMYIILFYLKQVSNICFIISFGVGIYCDDFTNILATLLVTLHIWFPINVKLQWRGGGTSRPSAGREFNRNSVLVGILNHFIYSWLSLIFYRSQMPHLTIHKCILLNRSRLSSKF